MSYLDDLSQYAHDGFREFTEHPVDYTLDAMTGFWDLVPPIALALAWTPHGEILGEYQAAVAVGGSALVPFICCISGSEESNEAKGYRIRRNLAAWFSTIAIASDISHDGTFLGEIGDKFVDSLGLGGFVVMEHARRDTSRVEESLETV